MMMKRAISLSTLKKIQNYLLRKEVSPNLNTCQTIQFKALGIATLVQIVLKDPQLQNVDEVNDKAI